jgi:hypothetical protein
MEFNAFPNLMRIFLRLPEEDDFCVQLREQYANFPAY